MGKGRQAGLWDEYLGLSVWIQGQRGTHGSSSFSYDCREAVEGRICAGVRLPGWDLSDTAPRKETEGCFPAGLGDFQERGLAIERS